MVQHRSQLLDHTLGRRSFPLTALHKAAQEIAHLPTQNVKKMLLVQTFMIMLTLSKSLENPM